MEFKDRLQALRKRNGLTQEQLAEKLHISRTAISKWESGRGMPNIEALKNISALFHISLDELLTGQELLNAAEMEGQTRVAKICDLVFGILDTLTISFAFLPLFGQRIGNHIYAVSLQQYTDDTILQTCFYTVFFAMGSIGLVALVIHCVDFSSARRPLRIISLFLHSSAIALFIATRDPYVAFFLFIFLLIKISILLRSLR